MLAYDATSSKSYVWDPTSGNANKWIDITGNTLGYRICGFTSGSKDCTDKLYYAVYPVNPTPTWKVSMYKNFGSKTMYTAGFVTDNNNLSSYQADINP